MGTQINVIVDNGGLSAKAKQQTQANRWSKLESANRQKVEAAGTQQRDATRAQQGIGADGRPLFGTPPAQVLRRDEPAARQLGGNKIDMLMVPDQGFSVAGNIPIRSKDSAYGVATSVEFANTTFVTYGDAVFSSNEGPGGTSALTVGDIPATEYGYEVYEGTIGTASNGPWQAVGYEPGVALLKKANGSIEPIKSKLKARDCKTVTFEVLLKIARDGQGGPNTISRTYLYLDIYDKPNNSNRGLSFYVELIWDSLGATDLGYFYLASDVAMSDNSTFGAVAVEGSGFHFDDNGNLEPWSQNNPALPEPLLGEWMHWAFVKSSEGVAVYFQGAPILSVLFADFPTDNPADAGAFASGTNSYANPYIEAKVAATCITGIAPPSGTLRFIPVFIHGMRLTPKALYTSNFTPPTSITSYG